MDFGKYKNNCIFEAMSCGGYFLFSFSFTFRTYIRKWLPKYLWYHVTVRYHNGAPLPAAHRFRPMFDFGYVALDILYAYPEDSGVYELVARNELGEVRNSWNLESLSAHARHLPGHYKKKWARTITWSFRHSQAHRTLRASLWWTVLGLYWKAVSWSTISHECTD